MTYSFRIQEIIKKYQEGSLVLPTESCVHVSDKQLFELLDSVEKGIPMGIVTVESLGQGGAVRVVDGTKRLYTLIQVFTGERLCFRTENGYSSSEDGVPVGYLLNVGDTMFWGMENEEHPLREELAFICSKVILYSVPFISLGDKVDVHEVRSRSNIQL